MFMAIWSLFPTFGQISESYSHHFWKQKLNSAKWCESFWGAALAAVEAPCICPCWQCFFSKVKFFDCIKSNLSVLYLPKWFKPRKVAHFKIRISYLFIHKFEYWSNSFRQRLNRTLMSNYNQSGFRKIFMKFRSVVNVRKFLDFFINYQVKFVS